MTQESPISEIDPVSGSIFVCPENISILKAFFVIERSREGRNLSKMEGSQEITG